ncbi:hypothetical protein [Pandoraea apista]|uniref:hypothetical protein n=1 Tax=Pandoraea apista TaxID=93218 RepID=UPI002F944D01
MSTLPCSDIPTPGGTSATDGLTPEALDFWERSFLAVLPAAMTVQNWSIDGAPVKSGNARINLAALWADSALLARSERATA